MMKKILYASILLTPASSFLTPSSSNVGTRVRKLENIVPLFESNIKDDEERDSQERRDFLIAAGSATMLPFIPSAFAESNISNSPICVIGANGKTGSECVDACISRGINVRATSRGGVYTGEYSSEQFLSTAPCDVTISSTVDAAIKGSQAVIFAASASKAGGTAAAVDNIGLTNVASSCIRQGIPHLVIVSSGAVTKPSSPVYKFLNLFGNIMAEKIKGEDTVRELYKDASSPCTYTVIRPGGLTQELARGVSALELNQGDTKSGRISRADVAALCIEATLHSKDSGSTTFECYDADTSKPLGTVGVSNIVKAKNKSDSEVFMSGKERRGETWGDIFVGLENDV